MSAPLVVSIPHSLGREEATRRLKTGLTRAASSVPVLQVDEERWEDDRMVFRVRALGQAASGHVDVADDHVGSKSCCPGCCSDLPKWRRPRFAIAAICCSQSVDRRRLQSPAVRSRTAAAYFRAGLVARCTFALSTATGRCRKVLKEATGF